MSIEDIILREVRNMKENDAKKILATILLNYEKVGKNGYTVEDFTRSVHSLTGEIVVDDMFFNK